MSEDDVGQYEGLFQPPMLPCEDVSVIFYCCEDMFGLLAR